MGYPTIQVGSNMVYEAGETLVKKYKFKRITKNVYQGRLISFENEKEYFNFLIKIDLNAIKKGNLPVVKEIENKIPNSSEYHKHVKSDSFCFGVGIYTRLIFNQMKRDFTIFIDKYVMGYLYSVTFKDIFGVWAADEFSHNEDKAKKEAFSKLFGLTGFNNITINQFKNNINDYSSDCFCNSGKSFTLCHLDFCKDSLEYLKKKEILSELSSIEVE